MSDAAPGTRARLLAAARELFTTTGYHDTTTPLIARHAGVAEGTIYRHFPSKHALLNAAYQDAQRWGTAEVRAGAEQSTPAGDRLRDIGRRLAGAAEREPALARLLLAWPLASELDDASRAAAAEFRQALEHLVATGKQEGSVRAGVVGLWTSVWLVLVTYAAERIASGEWTATHPHALATLDAAWDAIAWRPIAVGSAIPSGEG